MNIPEPNNALSRVRLRTLRATLGGTHPTYTHKEERDERFKASRCGSHLRKRISYHSAFGKGRT